MLNDKDFLHIEDYLDDDYWVTCFITARGLGKTHSAIEYANQLTKNTKDKFVVTRLNFECFKKFKVDIEKDYLGWKCSLAAQVIKKGEETIAHLSSLNTYANTKGGRYEDVKLMIFDEFNEDIYIENAYAKWVMMVDSFKRHRKDFKCILLGNAINKNNWFLNAMGVEIDLSSKKDMVYCLDEYKVKIVVIPPNSKTFEKLNSERSDITNLAKADASCNSFYNNGEFLNDETNYVTNFNRFVKDTFYPLFIFRKNDIKYIFGKYVRDNQVLFYIDRFLGFYKEYNNLKEFSFDTLSNASSKKTVVLDDMDLEDFQTQFFKIAKEEKLRYGSFDAFEDLKRFISLGSTFY